ncbi:MAG: plasmid stability protein [Akkermansiaceae bacterium]|jgi:plasmid stability protein
MKTTLDLPEDLVIEIKLKAAREHRKMKDVAAEALRKGLKADILDDESEKEALLQRRLAALNRLGPVDEAQSKALADYLVEYREDRETAFDRSER